MLRSYAFLHLSHNEQIAMHHYFAKNATTKSKLENCNCRGQLPGFTT